MCRLYRRIADHSSSHRRVSSTNRYASGTRRAHHHYQTERSKWLQGWKTYQCNHIIWQYFNVNMNGDRPIPDVDLMAISYNTAGYRLLSPLMYSLGVAETVLTNTLRLSELNTVSIQRLGARWLRLHRGSKFELVDPPAQRKFHR